MARGMRNGRVNGLQDAVIAKVLLWALCRHCGHTKRLDPVSLAYQHGPLNLDQLAGRMRCTRCGLKHTAVCPDYKQWAGRN